MRTVRVESLDDPRLSAYRLVRERDLAAREGLFIVEGRQNVRVLLSARGRYRARSVFLTPNALDALRDALKPLGEGTPVFVGEQGLMNGVVGFNIHRGCLAAGERGEAPDAEDLVGRLGGSGRSLVVVLEGLNNHDNIGGIFRNAAAFGADGVLLDPRCADPLYRKAIRVSMGGALVIPHARFRRWPDGLGALREAGYVTIALTPSPDAPEIGDLDDTVREHPRLALLLGAEGPGLTRRALGGADHRARIAMRTDLVDSLNVAATSAVALHHLTRGWRR